MCLVRVAGRNFEIMPASSLFADLDRPNIGDDRAYQLALELSMLGLSDPLTSASEPDSPADLGNFVNPLTSVVGLDEVRSKKSQNMTECVPVPSSEHVAEIVGRQGTILFLLLLYIYIFISLIM